MKINKVISNEPHMRYMNVQKGVFFKRTIGDVIFGVLPKIDPNDSDTYGYRVRVGRNVAESCKTVGGSTDFNVACDMLLEEVGALSIITK